MTLNTDKPDYSLTTFDYVVIEKDKLLSKLRDNRDGHNAIYEAACSGYWIEAARVLSEKTGEFARSLTKATKTFEESFRERSLAVQAKDLGNVGGFAVGFGFSASWPLSYPTNHLEDYDRVISQLEFSIADKVDLKADDFNRYVRNNWQWNKDFSTSNQTYVSSALMESTGSMRGRTTYSTLGVHVAGFAASGALSLIR